MQTAVWQRTEGEVVIQLERHFSSLTPGPVYIMKFDSRLWNQTAWHMLILQLVIFPPKFCHLIKEELIMPCHHALQILGDHMAPEDFWQQLWYPMCSLVGGGKSHFSLQWCLVSSYVLSLLWFYSSLHEMQMRILYVERATAAAE